MLQQKTGRASATWADHRGLTVGDLIDKYINDRDGVDNLSRSKAVHLRLLRSLEIAQAPALGVTSVHLVEHVRARRKGGTGGIHSEQL